MFATNIRSLESEAGFRVLFESATIGILVVGRYGQIELINPCAEKIFGYSVAELIGESIEILIPDSLRDRHSQHREGYFANPKARPMGLGMELFAKRKNGSVFPVEISLGHYELEGNPLAVAFVTDVTEQVKARKMIADREAWFRNMANNSPVMIWVSDGEKRYSYFNDTWLQFTGQSIAEGAHDAWTKSVHPNDLERCREIYARAFEAKRKFSDGISPETSRRLLSVHS